MICKNCKAEIQETSIYCPHCGFQTFPEQEKMVSEKKRIYHLVYGWGKPSHC